MSFPASTLSSGALSGHHPAAIRGSLMTRALNLLALRRQRRALARLDAELLKDIGITPDEARTEAARRLWDVPPGWRS
ncbi:DUF1127 domain-containing protein [Vannielia litorea]|uniref:DUF1127 domain-containing protein n=1 Tax=Vannielia litorea TaxID=1217970 RepID=UPI001C947235|nr:DUF1127 domain-containing protein [Vannielia litorea]MBY6075384.1 DUF1127 domain-containing protein [Vannielia litorea]